MISTSEAGRVNALGRDIFYNTACDLYYERLHVAPVQSMGHRILREKPWEARARNAFFFILLLKCFLYCIL